MPHSFARPILLCALLVAPPALAQDSAAWVGEVIGPSCPAHLERFEDAVAELGAPTPAYATEILRAVALACALERRPDDLGPLGPRLATLGIDAEGLPRLRDPNVRGGTCIGAPADCIPPQFFDRAGLRALAEEAVEKSTNADAAAAHALLRRVLGDPPQPTN